MPSIVSMTFTIALQPGGRSFQCAGSTDVLRAGLAQGIALRYSCRSGVCRTCRARLVEGTVDYGAVNSHYLTDAEKEQGFVHLCCARPLSDCVVEVAETNLALLPVKVLPARVLKMERLAPDVCAVLLGLPPNEPLLYRAGQYLSILLPGGGQRYYSIATCPRAQGVRQLELHIRHLPGGVFTDQVFGSMKLRDLLRVEAPQGSFYLRDESDKPVLLVATGTGFAPIQALVEASIAAGGTRPMHLYWGGRHACDLYRHTLAVRWATEHAHIRYTPVLSHATDACHWKGRSGFVHRAVLEDYPDLSGHQVYACGAPAMVDAARRDFSAQARLPVDEFLADAFITQAELASATAPA